MKNNSVIIEASILAAVLMLSSCSNTGISGHSKQSNKPGSEVKPVQGADQPVKVRGKLFRVETMRRSCELLKETVIDPGKNEGESRWKVQWREDARLIKVITQNCFTGVSGTVWAHFRQLKPEDGKAASEGRPFAALNVTILAEGESRAGLASDDRNILVQFTPDPAGEGLRGGVAKLGGKDVPVRLRGPRAQVELHLPAKAEELGRGFWEAELSGKRQNDGTFTSDSMQLYQLADPRAIDDPRLPRVLVVGDSISMNYHDSAKAALKGIANYYRVEGNAGPSDRGVSCMELWLGDYTQAGLKWDLIQFNHGLHDLKQLYNTNSFEYGAYQISIREYQTNLEKEIAIMKKTGAKIMWCSTTPVPGNSNGVWGDVAMGRKKDSDMVFNEAAMEVVKRHPDILINELNGFIRNSPAFDDWRKQKDVHFWDQRTAKVLGEAVAEAVKKALQ